MAYDHFMTPPHLLEKVKQFYGGTIDFDAASNFIAQKYVHAHRFAVTQKDTDEYLTIDNSLPYGNHVVVNSLVHLWKYSNIWLNPPYSRDLIKQFTYKAIEERQNYQQLLYLVNTCSDTSWYHRMLHFADAMLLFRGRLKFWKIFNGEAHEKWEGEKSKTEGRGKIGNSPRFLNTLFYVGNNKQKFREHFLHFGTIIDL